MAFERALRLRWAAFALAVSMAGAAQAAPSAAERETARHLFDEGRARMRANEPLRAIEAFEKAHEIVHVPTTGLALARAHLAAGHLIEARDIALDTSRLPREGGEPPVLDEARQQARELEAQVRPRVPALRIHAKGAIRVAVDTKDIPVGTGPVFVNPGKHTITAINAEGIEAREDVEIAERETKDVDLTFTRADRVVITPVRTEPRSERTSTARTLVIGGLGLAAVGIAVGTTTGVLTLSRASDLDAHCANDVCAPSARDDLDGARTLGMVSTIGFVAAAVGLAALVVGLTLPRSAPTTTGPHVRVGTRQGGLAF
jgi:hypothetical protein